MMRITCNKQYGIPRIQDWVISRMLDQYTLIEQSLIQYRSIYCIRTVQKLQGTIIISDDVELLVE